jgi:hypothetical protein
MDWATGIRIPVTGRDFFSPLIQIVSGIHPTSYLRLFPRENVAEA